jgi:hypothetical protein
MYIFVTQLRDDIPCDFGLAQVLATTLQLVPPMLGISSTSCSTRDLHGYLSGLPGLVSGTLGFGSDLRRSLELQYTVPYVVA